ncbi:MAG TPA: aminotransferase class III-fold pyridoxal phosphate-dependent enzyme [Ktedonobacteraceae bacterium]|nr:aminotransferase class III-fold pyridoxal phosphate-dependent enzyme [Ktedonobacteraceae bacterium]
MEKNNHHAVDVEIKKIFSQLLGIDADTIDHQSTFLSIGADSLLLLQASQRIQHTFGVKVPFRALLEEYSTIEQLAAFLKEQAPGYTAEAHSANKEATTAVSEALPAPEVSRHHPGSARPATREIEHYPAEHVVLARTEIEQIVRQQLHIMHQQLNVLQSLPLSAPREKGASIPLQPATTTPLASEGVDHASQETPTVVSGESSSLDKQALSLRIDGETYVPYQPRRIARLSGLTEQQRQHVEALIARYARRTEKSKQYAQQSRRYHADNRGTAGFNLTFKEAVYPLIIKHAYDAHILDVDDNEYVDIAMGFGALLFGHSPAFLMEALEQQFKHGIGLGLQSGLVGEAARLLCELTGMERASFCNSGTEAVMTALRLARTVTGRNKVLVFGGAFHGTFDGVLVRGQQSSHLESRAVPLAPGVTSNLIGDVILADFGKAETIDLLKKHAHELAAVLVELPQSRRPDFAPLNFMQELRDITAEAGVALVFDEVVTGFRSHPGGAQALFGIKADLATYGKAMGGGLPVAAIAGAAKFMDAVDGGVWDYGDDSYPSSIQTFFAGTYFKHPLLMPAVYAVLNHFKQSGPQLQERLNRRTEALVDQIDRFFEEVHAPVRTIHFGSLFRFSFPPQYKTTDANVFYYHLLENGVNLPETRNGFLSTAHTDEDVEHILWAVKDAFDQTRSGGFLAGSLEEIEEAHQRSTFVLR